MSREYVVIGRFGQIDLESIFEKELINNIEKLLTKKKISKRLVKAVIATGISIVLGIAFQDIVMASEINNAFVAHGEAVSVMALPTGKGYANPTNLDAILKFIDWLIFMVRWLVSSIIGLIATYAGYKWSTDISGNGVADAKKILKNCAVGMFFVHFGATIANYFVDKIQTFI